MSTLITDGFADDDKPKRYSNIITGPQGWTESFDEKTVDTLRRMGAIRQTSTTSTADWQTTFYVTVGVEEKDE